jgi:single-strand DNA-binding protein
MSKSLNKVLLIGNLGKEPEIKYTQAGVAVGTFSLACNESWKDTDGNQQEKTEWINIVVWKKLAEICGQYLHKGDKAYFEGRLQTRSYDDKNSGVKKYITEVVADRMLMLTTKPAGAGGSAPQGTGSASGPQDDDPLPF